MRGTRRSAARGRSSARWPATSALESCTLYIRTNNGPDPAKLARPGLFVVRPVAVPREVLARVVLALALLVALAPKRKRTLISATDSPAPTHIAKPSHFVPSPATNSAAKPASISTAGRP